MISAPLVCQDCNVTIETLQTQGGKVSVSHWQTTPLEGVSAASVYRKRSVAIERLTIHSFGIPASRWKSRLHKVVPSLSLARGCTSLGCQRVRGHKLCPCGHDIAVPISYNDIVLRIRPPRDRLPDPLSSHHVPTHPIQPIRLIHSLLSLCLGFGLLLSQIS